MSEPIVYLASQSPRRRELLRQIGIPHQLLTVAVPEEIGQGEPGEAYVVRLAVEKALAGWRERPESPVEAVVIGSDTIVVAGDQVLEKPLDQAHGAEMLRQLSGGSHRVMTAVALVKKGEPKVRLSISTVNFRAISEDEIERYWLTGEPKDKAGGYGIQGFGAVFVESIEGCYSTIVGLPLRETHELITEAGVSVWQSPIAD